MFWGAGSPDIDPTAILKKIVNEFAGLVFEGANPDPIKIGSGLIKVPSNNPAHFLRGPIVQLSIDRVSFLLNLGRQGFVIWAP